MGGTKGRGAGRVGGANPGKFAAAGGGVAPGATGKATRGWSPRRGRGERGAGRAWAPRTAVGSRRRRREIEGVGSATVAAGGDRRSAGR